MLISQTIVNRSMTAENKLDSAKRKKSTVSLAGLTQQAVKDKEEADRLKLATCKLSLVEICLGSCCHNS